MNLESLASICNRLFFIGAFALFAIAMLEKLTNVLGYTIIGQSYSPGRLFEFAAIMLLFVITLLLRNIRESARAKA